MLPPREEDAIAAGAAVAIPGAVGAGAERGSRQGEGFQESAVQLPQVQRTRRRLVLHKHRAYGHFEAGPLCKHTRKCSSGHV